MGALSHSLFAQLIVRLILVYGYGASRLSVQPNVVRSYKVELSTIASRQLIPSEHVINDPTAF